MAVLFIITFLFSSVCRAEVPEEMFGSFADKEKYQNIMVEKVLSADRIVLEDGKKIRLIGIKAPEPPSKPKVEYDKTGKPVEPEIFPENTIEEKAYAFAHKLLYGKRVRLVFDETKTDEKLVTLAYVFVLDSGIMANAEILRMGYADLQIIAPNFKYEDQLRAAYREARSEQRGLQSD